MLHSLEPKAEWELNRERLKLIYEFVTQFSENQDLSILAEKVFTKLKDTFEQDRSYLALFQEGGTLKLIFSDPFSRSSPVSRSIINRLFQNGESFLLEDALSEESLKQQENIIALRTRSALAERVEMVLREVDNFVKSPPPHRKLERVDYLIHEVIKDHNWEWLKNGDPPPLSISTSQVLVPLDADLFKKALSLIFREIAVNNPQGVKFGILLQHSGNELEIVIGDIGENRASYKPFDPELQSKP